MQEGSIDLKSTNDRLLLFSQALDEAADGIQITDLTGHIIYSNKAVERIYGFSPQEYLGKHVNEMNVDPVFAERVILPSIIKSARWAGELLVKHKNGTTFPIWLSTSIVTNEAGQPMAMVGIIRDITEMKLASQALEDQLLLRQKVEQEIWEEKERAQVTLQSIGDAVITTDLRGNVEYINPVAEDLTGWSPAEAKARPLADIFNVVDEESGNKVEDPVQRCIREGRIVGIANHTELIHRDGHRFSIEDSASPIKNRCGEIIGAILVFHNVTEKRDMLRQMMHQAYHDSLTGLPNRVLFNDRLTLAIAQAHRNNEMLAVVFLDLDRFKQVNDMMGHAKGDTLLKEVAVNLSRCLRNTDTVARLGGDEFAILLPRVRHVEKVAKIAQKIIEYLNRTWKIDNQEFHITASLGIALYPSDGYDPETLLRHADTAMYRAKDRGRNNYQLYTPAMNTRITERLNMENDLRHALDRGEFRVFYQPQINFGTGQIAGVEALVRWQHPHRGLTSPAEFIPLAEETGLIVPIGEWVMRQACAANMAWRNKGIRPIKVSVNISACQFGQYNLTHTVAEILKDTGLEPEWLELEITESALMMDVKAAIITLKDLRKMGVNISIDDFGTGYSSLAYLTQFPIHTLKIDRSFIKDVASDPGDAAIVSTVIAMAQNLNLKVIAEGVETEEQLAFLEQRHCMEVQGFLFSKPVPPEELEEILRKNVICIANPGQDR